MAAQGIYQLPSNCTYEPDIGSSSRVVLVISGFYVELRRVAKRIAAPLGRQL